MVCQYSTRGLMLSGQRDRVLDPGAAEGGEDASEAAIGTVIVGHSPALSEPLTAITRHSCILDIHVAPQCPMYHQEPAPSRHRLPRVRLPSRGSTADRPVSYAEINSRR